MVSYRVFDPHIDEVNDELSGLQDSKRFPDIETTTDEGEWVVKDLLSFKRNNFLALIASLPVLAGLIVGLVLIGQRQNFQQRAKGAVSIRAKAECVAGKGTLRVIAESSQAGYKVLVFSKDGRVKLVEKVLLQGLSDLVVIPSLDEKLPSGSLRVIISKDSRTVEEVVDYEGIECGVDQK